MVSIPAKYFSKVEDIGEALPGGVSVIATRVAKLSERAMPLQRCQGNTERPRAAPDTSRVIASADIRYGVVDGMPTYLQSVQPPRQKAGDDN